MRSIAAQRASSTYGDSPLTVPLSVQTFLNRLPTSTGTPTKPAGSLRLLSDSDPSPRCPQLLNDTLDVAATLSRMAGVASFQPKNILDLSRAQSGAAQIDPKLKECLVPALGWALCHFRIAAARHCAGSSCIFAASPAGIISRTFQSFASVRRQWERRSRRQSVQAIVGAKGGGVTRPYAV